MRPLAIVLLLVLAGFRAPGQVALSPATPVISPSPVFVADSPALTPAGTTPPFVSTNASLAALAGALVCLQTNIQQTLPVLTMFNDNFDFVSFADNGSGSTASSAPAGNFSSNLAANYAANFGVNAATPTGPPLITSTPTQAVPSAAGLPQGVARVPVTRDSLRSLLILQDDLQRALPLLVALNGGTTNFPGSFSNSFGLTPTGR